MSPQETSPTAERYTTVLDVNSRVSITTVGELVQFSHYIGRNMVEIYRGELEFNPTTEFPGGHIDLYETRGGSINLRFLHLYGPSNDKTILGGTIKSDDSTLTVSGPNKKSVDKLLEGIFDSLSLPQTDI